MARVQSFAPIADGNAEILILGSMPGRASLTAGQYYAHPQNAFWRILGELLGFDESAPYPARIAHLRGARIALWDVLQSCMREGSLDARIERDTEVANDFETFLQAHKKISCVFFNGTVAETCFKRQVVGKINSSALDLIRLPSTSPANASISYHRKLDAWRAVLGKRGA